MKGGAGRIAGFVGHFAGELGFLLGIVGLLWLGAYLYELGYAARFQVPLAHVDVGFPRPLLLIAAAATSVAALAALVMLVAERAYPFIGDLDRRTVRRVVTGIAIAGVLAALLAVPEREPLAWLDDAPFALALDPIPLALAGGLIVHAAAIGASWRRIARQGDWSLLAAGALAILVLGALPASLGWWQAGKRMDMGRGFFVLQDDPDYRMVRLYGARALFAHWDPATGRFDGNWRVERFDREEDLLTRLARSGGS